ASAIPSAPTATQSSAAAPSAPPASGAATAVGSEAEGEGRMTPAVRRLLREHGLAASQIVGTGGGGRITREDVTNYVESQRTGQPGTGQIAPAGGPEPTASAPSASPAAPSAASASAAAASATQS